jgi:hypothetical protein
MSAQLERRVEELEARVDELEDMVSGASVMTPESDLCEFLRVVDPATHVERATAIGFHLLHNEGKVPFTVADVEEAYEKCRIPKPANLSDVLAGAAEKDWLIRKGTKGQNALWSVSQKGDEAVNRGFA